MNPFIGTLKPQGPAGLAKTVNSRREFERPAGQKNKNNGFAQTLDSAATNYSKEEKRINVANERKENIRGNIQGNPRDMNNKPLKDKEPDLVLGRIIDQEAVAETEAETELNSDMSFTVDWIGFNGTEVNLEKITAGAKSISAEEVLELPEQLTGILHILMRLSQQAIEQDRNNPGADTPSLESGGLVMKNLNSEHGYGFDLGKIRLLLQNGGLNDEVNLKIERLLEIALKQLNKQDQLPPQLAEVKSLLNTQLSEPSRLGEVLNQLAHLLTGLSGKETKTGLIPGEHDLDQPIGENKVKISGIFEAKPVNTVKAESQEAQRPVILEQVIKGARLTDDNSVNQQQSQQGSQVSTEHKHAEIQKAAQQPVQSNRPVNMIFSQIVQKAKLEINPDTTRMQIQLKPDHLGKLNLSIVSENGVVTAKFSTETYHVKGIIETNLNVLKDALSEQGVKVDQIVVNVGAERDFSEFRQRENARDQNPTGKPNNFSLPENVFEEMFAEDKMRGAIGAYYGNSVDFTA